MSAEQQSSSKSIRDSIPWLVTFLSYTDDVCKAVTEANRDWRMSDPQENWYLSLLEQVMHIADSRFDVLANIEDGLEESATHQAWCTEFASIKAPWKFREAKVEDVLASLAQARTKIDAWLDQPAAELLAITDGSRKLFTKRIEDMKAGGKDTAALEKRGPTPVINMLLFLAAHEQSHRSLLQHHLRVSGNEVPRYA